MTNAGWAKIVKQFKEDHKIYSSRTRNAIISDAFAAAAINRVNYTTVFDLLQYLDREKDYIPWNAALKGFHQVGLYFLEDDDAVVYKRYLRKVLKPVYEERFFENVKEHHKDDKFFLERVAFRVTPEGIVNN
ncbi:hypothetical protein OSTOST_05638 [Ostertagia ostertagi]